MNNCFGCLSVRRLSDLYKAPNHCYLHTMLEYDNSDGGCPCTSCIVKPMCNVKCSDFENYKKLLRSKVVWKDEYDEKYIY